MRKNVAFYFLGVLLVATALCSPQPVSADPIDRSTDLGHQNFGDFDQA